MKCPVCGERLRVTDTRSTADTVTRKRECPNPECSFYDYTTEKLNATAN